MFENPYYNYPIDKVVEALGGRKGGKDMYFSPLRDEKTPSLHVDRKKNLWYDHGAGMGGTNVQLIMMLKRCSQKEAYRFISSLDPTVQPVTKEQMDTDRKSGNRIVSVGCIRSEYLTNYILSRKIPLELARRYCREVIMKNETKNQHYTLIGFRNNADGYTLRSPSGYKSTNKSGITTIDLNGTHTVVPSSDTVSIFEGFFDFMSWLVLQSVECPTCDAVVLNSVALFKYAEDYVRLHDKIILFLDNDAAGEKTVTTIRSVCSDKEITDMSSLYKEYKDLNEMLQNSSGFRLHAAHGI